MKYDSFDCLLAKKQELADGIFSFNLTNKELAAMTKPGQFAHVAVPGKMLRRPISVCDVSGDSIRLVFQVKGEGTKLLSEAALGSTINVLAPLGNGFNIEKGKKYAFIGGGIGVPPMLYASKQSDMEKTAILGFRNKSAVILERDFIYSGNNVIVTTDDGSYGKKGFVTDALKDIIDSVDVVCACGPMVMLKGVALMAKEHNKPCFVSLEERMGCGIGACLVCACKTKKQNSDETTYTHVCKNGPVYNAEEVVW